MKWFLNLRIAARLIVSFLFVALIAGVVGVIGLININSIVEADKLMFEENTLGLQYTGNASVYYQRVRFNLLKMTMVTNAEDINTCISNIKDFSAKNDELLEKYNDGITSDKDRNLFDSLKPQWEQYKSSTAEVIELVQAGQKDKAIDLILGDMADAGSLLQNSFDSLFEYNSSEAKARSDNNTQLADTATLIMIIVIIAGIIISVALGIFISGIISKPVRKLAEAADKLALGDVNVNIKADTSDEIGKLTASFGDMIENIRSQAIIAGKIADGDLSVAVAVKSENDLLGKKLYELVEKNNEVLSSITSASEQVASGAKQVSDSSIALSQGATEQASSIEQLTASIEEISAQTKQNAENANQANELADTAKANAEQGNTRMKEMLKAMQDINASSASISKIIKVIDEIAFQTNILALNAAVEAARAGQHGKGFAVVAEEVRNLAARSANAAKETTDMIESSIKKAEDGTRIANETAGALVRIVEGISKVASLVDNIAVASNEQSTGINQINQGVMQISQVVQNNSATSEESAAASEELSSQAELLKEQVERFKLKKGARRSFYRGTEELNPEVLRMLETMSQNNKPDENMDAEADIEASAVCARRIALSDKEFGKY
ncbi:methyl-accepting chemotaxis protein [Ruminiclostridium sufflavum DSM 19573]|uniref:Methyl-accepting chemotaxis protein n=1 Tax=Ruminiclostridium sufflavum DSM 19573 TaxID=1121337 RepID=A0A318XN82_9FIRM|nr:HAMP domain-containing methyl-accepting chemotaxis protein [Ruminiclostridium sufflavum]PYG88251.1 methyl-accepting chemotaxis protein [Ruminiclostridium sufflavum DSM 19573]